MRAPGVVFNRGPGALFAILLASLSGAAAQDRAKLPGPEMCAPPDPKVVVEDAQGRYPNNQLVIGLAAETFDSRARSLAKKFRARVVCTLPKMNLVLLQFPGAHPDMERLRTRVLKEAGVVSVMRNYLSDLPKASETPPAVRKP